MNEDMTYSESAKGITITIERAQQEIESHGCSWEDFLGDIYGYNRLVRNAIGTGDYFWASDILTWLGY